MQAEINTLTSTRVPRSLTELITLGRTLKRRTTDIQAYFDHPHTTNDPTKQSTHPSNTYAAAPQDFPKPHPQHHPNTPQNRRIQTPTTPPITKSRLSVAGAYAGQGVLDLEATSFLEFDVTVSCACG